MNRQDVEALIEGLINTMTDSSMCEHQLTGKQVELIRAYKSCWVKYLPDSGSQSLVADKPAL